MNELRRIDARSRAWLALILVLAADYLALGLASGGHVRVLGIGGGVLIVAACIAAAASTPRLAVALAALGATPLAVSTWWSIVTPVLATVTIAITLAAVRRMQHRKLGPSRRTITTISPVTAATDRPIATERTDQKQPTEGAGAQSVALGVIVAK